MHDAALYFCFWENSIDSVSKSGQSVNGYNHDIFYTTIFDFVQNTKSVFGTFVSAYPQPQDFFASV